MSRCSIVIIVIKPRTFRAIIGYRLLETKSDSASSVDLDIWSTIRRWVDVRSLLISIADTDDDALWRSLRSASTETTEPHPGATPEQRAPEEVHTPYHRIQAH